MSSISSYSCKHCDAEIQSLDIVVDHPCFRGKEVYMDVNNNNILFTLASETETPLAFAEGENVAKETPCKQPAAWTKTSTYALLSLYEANLHTINHKNKKTQLWHTLAMGLKEFGVFVTHDQVRSKINVSEKKYKECVDNNSKSGRKYQTFEFFDALEEIHQLQANCGEVYTLSSNLPNYRRKDNLPNKNQLPQTDDQLPIDLTNNNDDAAPSSSKGNETITAAVAPEAKKRKREAHGTCSTVAATKREIERQFLNHLEANEVRQKDVAEKRQNYLRLKEEENALKKRRLEICEKQMEHKRLIEEEKLKLKREKHNDKMRMEQLKCKYLEQLIQKQN